jgi:hypothetical protein
MKPSEKISRTGLALVGAQMGLAAVATGLDLAQACGACSRGGAPHLAIAAAGVAGYGALLGVGLAGKRGLFGSGVWVALGIHGALGILLFLERRVCLPCLLSLGVAFALAGLEMRSRALTPRRAMASVSALAVTLFGLSGSLAQAQERPWAPGAVARIAVPRTGSALRALDLDVYEASHCSYCADFRDRYLPRLKEDFAGLIEVRFHDAREAGWVERTPTFLLGGRLLFEGLPLRYEDLAETVMESLR